MKQQCSDAPALLLHQAEPSSCHLGIPNAACKSPATPLGLPSPHGRFTLSLHQLSVPARSARLSPGTNRAQSIKRHRARREGRVAGGHPGTLCSPQAPEHRGRKASTSAEEVKQEYPVPLCSNQSNSLHSGKGLCPSRAHTWPRKTSC